MAIIKLMLALRHHRQEISETQRLPLPRGNSSYALGKRAEYKSKDLDLAKRYYEDAIKEGDRVESAIKDMAGILHQEGKTEEAIEYLLRHKDKFTEVDKLDNLISTLQSKLHCKGNNRLKDLRLTPISESDSIASVKRMFKDSTRIKDVNIVSRKSNSYALIKFQSHTAARKTLKTFLRWKTHQIEWVNAFGHSEHVVNHQPVGDLEFLLGKDLLQEIFSPFDTPTGAFVPEIYN